MYNIYLYTRMRKTPEISPKVYREDEDEDDDDERGGEGRGVAVEEGQVAAVAGLPDDGVAGDAALGAVGGLPDAAGRVEPRAVRHRGHQRGQQEEVLAQAVLPRVILLAAGPRHRRPAQLASGRPASAACGYLKRASRLGVGVFYST